ncbi:MAG: M48 family metallopeptidase [Alphaproteobacteria bacterium]|nr:M48 family metallopeptidase [Alphaproteobacteria bacterium]
MIFRLFLICMSLLAAAASPAGAASLIRDTEVENTIRAFETPLLEAAGLDPNAFEVHIVNEKSLNAFVAGGQKMFLHTGLLLRAQSASQVIGVMAHETGHIAGGHLARLQQAFEDASNEAIIATVLGVAAGVLSGRADVGTAVVMGGQDVALKNLLTFSRGQESSADQAGITYLNRTQQSAKGFLEFMEILGQQELWMTERQDPYVRTHPISQERVSFLREQVEKSQYTDTPLRPEYALMFRRMQAKLFAFIEAPVRTLSRYKADDTSIEARMARAIAYYRKPDLANALPLIDGLIKEYPNDAYFYELKGQFLFENGRIAEAKDALVHAARLMPEAPLILVSLAQAQIEMNDDSLLPEASRHLQQALTKEKDNALAWRLMSVAYGRSGNQGMTAYAMAEYAFLSGKLAEASHHADQADKLLARGSPPWLAVQDLKSDIQTQQAKKRKKK